MSNEKLCRFINVNWLHKRMDIAPNIWYIGKHENNWISAIAAYTLCMQTYFYIHKKIICMQIFYFSAATFITTLISVTKILLTVFASNKFHMSSVGFSKRFLFLVQYLGIQTKVQFISTKFPNLYESINDT